LFVESLLLSLAGGVLGTMLALYGVDVLVAFAPKDIPRIESASVNGWVLLFTVLLVAASAIATAILPALQTRSISEQSLLQETGTRGGTEGRNRRRLRGVLMAGEVAVGTALLIGGGLLVDSARRLSQVQPGFAAPDRVLTFRVTLPRPKYQPQDKRKQFYENLLAKLRALPGVTDAAAVLLRPLSGTVGWDFPFSVEGQTEQQAAANPPSNFESISTNYFRTMAIPVLAGRDFTELDRTGSPSVAIINESFAKRYFPDGRVLGRRIKIGRPGGKQPWMEVVGVVRDVRYREWEAVRMDLYVPVMQSAQHRSDFVVRVRQGDVLRLTPEVRRAVLEVDPDQPVSSVTTVEGLVDGTLARPRFNAGLLTLFAICALLLVVAGVFGVLSQSVAERRQEIGIRLALGALPEQILRMILREGLLLIGGGILFGAVLALSMGRVMAHLLYGATWWEPAVYSISIGVVLVTGLFACLWPAMRASRSDPVAAMAGLSMPLSSQGQPASPPESPSTAGPRPED
jgi:predicted permease